MDNTKQKKFIAFINQEGKDRWWINGNLTYDSSSPTILPYDTKEDKANAIDKAKKMCIWEETHDIYGIVLSVVDKPFEIISFSDANKIKQEYEEEERLRKEERSIQDSDKKKKKKKEVVKKETESEQVTTPKEMPKEIKVNTTKKSQKTKIVASKILFE